MEMVNIRNEIARLPNMSPKQLRTKYLEVFGEPTRSGNKQHLVKRVAWRMQALAEGGLSERARRRATELACDADVRTTMPKAPPPSVSASAFAKTVKAVFSDDDRLPVPGTEITREYKGRMLRITVMPNGFEFEGEVYRSLSAVAKAITGTHANGYQFFRLGKYAP